VAAGGAEAVDGGGEAGCCLAAVSEPEMGLSISTEPFSYLMERTLSAGIISVEPVKLLARLYFISVGDTSVTFDSITFPSLRIIKSIALTENSPPVNKNISAKMKNGLITGRILLIMLIYKSFSIFLTFI
jgi:hypothetical protein